MYHRMVQECAFDNSCDKCGSVLSPAYRCITCAKGHPAHHVMVCLRCIKHVWSHTEHSGHMWMVTYQATDAGVVADNLRTWLKPSMQSQVPTREQIDAALAQQLEVCSFFIMMM